MICLILYHKQQTTKQEPIKASSKWTNTNKRRSKRFDHPKICLDIHPRHGPCATTLRSSEREREMKQKEEKNANSSQAQQFASPGYRGAITQGCPAGCLLPGAGKPTLSQQHLSRPPSRKQGKDCSVCSSGTGTFSNDREDDKNIN